VTDCPRIAGCTTNGLRWLKRVDSMSLEKVDHDEDERIGVDMT
jgi:hypothetical protein